MSTNSMFIYQDEEQLELVSRIIEGGYSQNKNCNICQGSGKIRTCEDACVERTIEKPPLPWSTNKLTTDFWCFVQPPF